MAGRAWAVVGLALVLVYLCQRWGQTHLVPMALTLPCIVAIELEGRPLSFYGLQWSFSQLLLGGTLALGSSLLYSLAFFSWVYWQGLSWTPPAKFSWTTVLVSQTLLVALPEELLFRGYFQSHRAEQISPSWAIWESAFVFGVAHFCLSGSWTRMSVFFPGLLFAWLREKSGGLWGAVLLHSFSNTAYFFLWRGLGG